MSARFPPSRAYGGGATAEQIEREYFNDIAYLTWEIMRYRRFKTIMINNGFRDALKKTLRSILLIPRIRGIEAADELTEQWFFDRETKGRVSELLEEAGLDEMAIEAEALTLRFAEIEKIDRFVVSADVRRNKPFALWVISGRLRPEGPAELRAATRIKYPAWHRSLWPGELKMATQRQIEAHRRNAEE